MGISSNFTPGRLSKYDEFTRIALQSGLVKSFMSLARLDAQDRERGSAAYHAGDTFGRLVMTGDVAERRSLRDDLLRHDAVTVIINKIEHPLCTQRQLSASWMRSLAAEAFLADAINGRIAGDIMEKFCQYSLGGPDLFIQQLTSPELSWQCEIAIGRDLPVDQARKYAPRYYALSQENSMWLVHALMCRDPLASHQFRLEILKHKPHIIDLLAKCGTLIPEAWYPENECDSIACEALALLFLPSLNYVSGIPITLTDSLQAEDDAEYNALNECLEILFSRDRWVELLVGIWKRLDDEKWQDTLHLFKRVARDHLAVESPDESSFNSIFEYRGTSRICVLRIIATATHASNGALITDSDLFPLLRLAYLGCQRAQAAKAIDAISTKQEMYSTIEVTQEIMREPLYAKSVPFVVEATEVIPPMPVMATIALVRVLTLITQRGLLKKIPAWQRLPDGTSKSVSLRQVQQIVSPLVMEKSLKYAMKTVVSRKETGTNRMREGKFDDAMSTYVSSAELAVTLLTFDEATGGEWAPQLAAAREEAVKSLGNASEMAFKIKKYRRALRFATGAVSIGEDAPSDNLVTPALITKNKRRMEACKTHVGP